MGVRSVPVLYGLKMYVPLREHSDSYFRPENSHPVRNSRYSPGIVVAYLRSVHRTLGVDGQKTIEPHPFMMFCGACQNLFMIMIMVYWRYIGQDN